MKCSYLSFAVPSARTSVSAKLVRSALLLSVALSPVACSAQGQVLLAAKPSAPVEALLYSTMPSTSAHNPQMAMDGQPDSYFKSVYNMDDGDDFLVMLSSPIPMQSLRIVTGTPDGDDLLTNGYVDASPDGVIFTKAATFNDAGVAEATLPNTMVKTLRIKLNRRTGLSTLCIREITLNSTDKISHVQMGPGRGFTDISQAPDLAAWAAKAESQMEAFWPDTAALLYSNGFITPNMVNVIYRTGPGVTDVAATGGGVMTVNAKWARENPGDTGLTVHEMAHVVQSMSAYNPVWLIEGVADYIRWVRYEPQNFTYRIDLTKSWNQPYRTSAAFLGWCEIHYNSRLVTLLNDDIRFGRYNDGLFKKYTGKDADTLWAEFLVQYKADPKSVLLVPVAPGDMPRVLPVVATGSSVPVTLTTAFNATGFATDGKTFGMGDGFDNGGTAFSAALLGTGVDSKNVHFNLGKADQSNIVSAQGQKIALPKGKYASLWLLAAAVEGGQKAQTFMVTYSDGTQKILVQNVSDWYAPEKAPGETRAVKMAYRNMGDGSKDPRTFYAYSYGFDLDKTKEVASLTLPNNPNVKVLAATLAN